MKAQARSAISSPALFIAAALLTTSCGSTPKPAPVPPSTLAAVKNADKIPSVVVLEYNDKGAPTNYLTPPSDALPVATGGKSMIVGTRRPEAAVPAEFDVAVLKMNAWNHQQVSMMGQSANQEFRIPVFDAPSEIREVIQSLHVGEMARIWVDDDTKPGATAVMDMLLVELVSPPKAPDNLAAAPAEATALESGIKIITTKNVESEDKPAKQDLVTIAYTSWDPEGKVLDASIWNPLPTAVELKSVPESIRAAMLTMSVGQEIRMWVPKELHDKKTPIVTEMRLLSITRRPAPLPAPEDVAAPPKRAKKTKSGLRYQILERKATSRKKPKAESMVEVHYTGWTTDGGMFDSSVARGNSATFPLSGVIPGWTEGLQLMRPGQRFRFWIPVELAYQGKPGAPAGMLVFDVELISIVEDSE